METCFLRCPNPHPSTTKCWESWPTNFSAQIFWTPRFQGVCCLMCLGSWGPRIFLTNTLGALGFAHKLFWTQVSPALFNDWTQVHLNLQNWASSFLPFYSQAIWLTSRRVPGWDCWLSHPHLFPPAYTYHSIQHRVPAQHMLAEWVPLEWWDTHPHSRTLSSSWPHFGTSWSVVYTLTTLSEKQGHKIGLCYSRFTKFCAIEHGPQWY